MSVFVVDKNHKPFTPCTERRARILLTQKRAVVAGRNPFVLRIKDREVENSPVNPVTLKIDPGSKTTGFAIVQEFSIEEDTQNALFQIELKHHGEEIKGNLQSRSNHRRCGCSENARYCEPRFLNRAIPKGWLPPSIKHRVDSIPVWGEWLPQHAPIRKLVIETVRFDLQKLQNPEISGVQNDIPKSHSLDAACTGKTFKGINWNQPVLKLKEVKCMERGQYGQTRVTKYGFLKGYCTRKKNHFGFQPGDLVKALVLKGKKMGTPMGRIAIGANGFFSIQTQKGLVQGVSQKWCKLLERADGYFYKSRSKPQKTSQEEKPEEPQTC
jgi:hypothetical protein